MGTHAAAGVENWHRAVRNMTDEALDELLAEDVVFHSPVVHTPQVGKALTKMYLMAAFNVLPGDSSSNSEAKTQNENEDQSESKFRYVREVVGDNDALLEFMTEVDGITINGIDLIRFNDEGKIVDFKVMVRPLKAIQKLHAQMAQMLETLNKSA